MSKTLIHNVRLAGEPTADAWILIDGDTIVSTGHALPHPNADEIVDGDGMLALPGAIDCHVHFREPGLTEKADIATESRAAVAGGVTSYLEMPNTVPQTTTIDLWEQKMQLGAEKSVANYAFFIGATNSNIDQLKVADYTQVPGVKLFMGSSTGNMLVDDDSTLAQIFREIDAIIAVHAEDQEIISKYTAMFRDGMEVDGDLPIELHSHIRSVTACYNSSRRAVELAKRYNRRLHLCHLTTAVETSLLTEGDPATKLITSEVSPHHLMWCTDDYADRGALIKMNPAVKDAYDRDELRKALEDGLIDMVATDHAPHLLSQKQGGALKAVSGAPLVQFALPWMLTHFDEALVKRVICVNPAKVYHIDRRGDLTPGNYADIVLVEKVEPYFISNDDVLSKCGWTPMTNQYLEHRIRQTWINGRQVYADGAFTCTDAATALRFNR